MSYSSPFSPSSPRRPAPPPSAMILTPEDAERIRLARPDLDLTAFWEPTPHQLSVLHRTEKEIGLFGGKFGGKSECAQMLLIKGNPHLPDYDAQGNLIPVNQSYIHHPMYRATVLRKNQIDLDAFLSKAAHRYKPLGGKFSNGEFRFPSGAVITCGHLADRDAWHKYIGIENIRFVVEEAALIGDVNLIDQILSCCRSVYPEMLPQVLFTSNFGGPGSQWIIDRFIEAVDEHGLIIPPNTTILKHDEDPLHPGEFLPHTRIWMPSTMRDNPYAEKDPSYRASLAAISDEKLRRAYIDGDWKAFQGTYFDISGQRPLHRRTSRSLPRHPRRLPRRHLPQTLVAHRRLPWTWAMSTNPPSTYTA